MRSLSTYAYLNASLRARLSRRLTEQQLATLARAADLTEVAGLLRDTDYRAVARVLGEGASLTKAEKAIRETEIARHRDVIRHAREPVRRVVFALMEIYDVEKVEGLLRLWSEKAWEERDGIIEEKICAAIPVEEILKASSIEEIILLLDATPYKRPLMASYERYRRSHQIFCLESAIETDYYRRTGDTIQELSAADRAAAARLIGVEIDIRNVEMLIRLMRYSNLPAGELPGVLLPGGSNLNERLLTRAYTAKSPRELMDAMKLPPLRNSRDTLEQLRLLQAILEEVVRAEARHALAGYPFTIGTVIAYFILGRSEARQIRRIIVGKYLGLSPDRIARAASGNR